MCSGWDAHIQTMMNDGNSSDAAIIGIKPFSIWACHPNGNFAGITQDQIKHIVNKDIPELGAHGMLLGKKKYAFLNVNTEKSTLLIGKGKSPNEAERCNVVIGQSISALVLLEGKTVETRSSLNGKVLETIECLNKAGI